MAAKQGSEPMTINSTGELLTRTQHDESSLPGPFDQLPTADQIDHAEGVVRAWRSPYRNMKIGDQSEGLRPASSTLSSCCTGACRAHHP